MPVFENDVNMYGTQALIFCQCIPIQFENDVNMYGTQAIFSGISSSLCLRMM